MNTNRQSFRDYDLTPTTRLSGVGRVHGDNLNTGTFSLEFKHLPKQSKPCVIRGKGQVFVLVHKAEREVLDSNQVVFSYKPITDLVQIIHSLIGNLFMQAGNLAVGFSLAVTTLDLSRGVTLQTAQFRNAHP